MKRRTFIGRVAAASMALASAPSAHAVGEADDVKQRLQGFIVSDAHFGWENAQQPGPETQRAAMAHILERFPGLDVVIDTGDAHHGNLRGAAGDAARSQWLDIIANGAGPLPFFYVPGNHEIVGSAEGCHEARCCRLGSLACRPYYSFDIQGIHFISVPEMMRAVYVTRETLEWLALDLAVNRARTTIILSHNNIIGTTGPYEAGYRGVVNSDALVALFKQNPQVIAWMHGHNHNYQVARRNDMLYVSNGRIGGFDPSRDDALGSHGLGGVYFAVSENGLEVRSYSASRECFLDALSLDNVSAVIETATSLTPEAPVAYSYGVGGARDGQCIPVHHHTIGNTLRRALYMTGVDDSSFNDDPDLLLYTARTGGGRDRPQRMLMGSDVPGRQTPWQWSNPGITLDTAATSGEEALVFTVPRGGRNQVAYYRCAPGRRYCFRMALRVDGPGGAVRLRGYMYDSQGNARYESPVATHEITAGEQEASLLMDIPEDAGAATVYENPDSDVLTQLSVEVRIVDCPNPLRIVRAELALAEASGKTLKPGIYLDDTLHAAEGHFSDKDMSTLPLSAKNVARELVRCQAYGNRRLSWLIREEGIEWQVRNAAAVMRDGWLEIGPIRDAWGAVPVAIIAPTTKMARPYVHRLRNVSRARIRYGVGVIEIQDLDFITGATLEMRAATPPVRLDGGEMTAFERGIGVAEIRERAMRILFA